MAVGKQKKGGKGGKRGKKKVIEPMSRKEWYDVVAPSNFKSRQFAKAICNKTIGIKLASDNLIGRVYEANHSDLDQVAGKDQPFRNIKFAIEEVQGRNLLTRFHALNLTTDKIRSLLRKWCTLIESVIEAKTQDGYVLRLFIMAFTKKQSNQLSKNCYAKTRLVKWVRFRMTNMVQKRIEKSTLDQVVTLLKEDVLSDSLMTRCNTILPLRDVKIYKVKVTRTPKFDGQKLLDSQGAVPVSHEGEAKAVEEAVEA